MKVQELIDILSELEPEAEVLVMSQQSWPFECSLHGVTTREELACADDDGSDEATARSCDDSPADVFLVEGEQLRYGSKAAWDVATR